jgi:thiol-disulfide isomerase/thioredoxin
MTDLASRIPEQDDNAVRDDSVIDESTPSDARPPGQSPIRTKVVPILALMLVAGLLGVLAYALFAPKDARVGQQGRVNSSGALVLEDGRMAPDFTVNTFDGGTFHLSDFRGKTVIVNFWASWCNPCKEEMPLLTTANNAFGDDVVMVGVNVWDDDGDAKDFLANYQVDYAAGPDKDGKIGIDYGISGVPETFVIDPQGHLVARLPGAASSLQQIQDMVAEAKS